MIRKIPIILMLFALAFIQPVFASECILCKDQTAGGSTTVSATNESGVLTFTGVTEIDFGSADVTTTGSYSGLGTPTWSTDQNTTFDDGSTDSPYIGWQDQTNELAKIYKSDAAGMIIINTGTTDGNISFQMDNDTDDFILFDMISANIPSIKTSGDCVLWIQPEGDQVIISSPDAAVDLKVRAYENTAASITMAADEDDEAKDQWKWTANDSATATLTLGCDSSVADAFVTTVTYAAAGGVIFSGTTPYVTVGDGGAEDAQFNVDGQNYDFSMGIDDTDDTFQIALGTTLGTTERLKFSPTALTATWGDATAADVFNVFDGTAQDYYYGIDDGTDSFILGVGNAMGTTPAITVNSSAVATFAQVPVITVSAAASELTILAANAQDAQLRLRADNGDDAGDSWEVRSGATNALSIGNDNAVVGTYVELASYSTTGDLTMKGTTPTLIVGDGGSEDSGVQFSGATDWYMAIDDTGGRAEDILTIGYGSTVGTTPALDIDANQDVVINQDLGILDDKILTFGTSDDVAIEWDDGVDDQLLIATTGTTATADTDPLFMFLADSGHANGSSMDADQMIFGVGKGTQAANTALFTVDEDGDVVITATAEINSSVVLQNDESIYNSTDGTIGMTCDSNESIVVDIVSANATNGTAAIALTSDAGDDAGDRWQIQANASENLVLSNDTSVADTFVTKLTIAGADGDITTTGDVEIVDDMDLVFGSAQVNIQFDNGTDDQFLVAMAGTTCTADTDPMFQIMADSGHANGSSLDAGQQVFGVVKGTQASNVQLFTVDAEGDGVIGNDFLVTADLTVSGGDIAMTSSTASKPLIYIENTADDATGPEFRGILNRANPADGDDLLRVSSYSDDSGGAQSEFAYLLFEATDVTATKEAGSLEFSAVINNTDTNFFKMFGDAGDVTTGHIEFNQDSADIDFHYDGNTTADFFLMDATAETVTFQSSITAKPSLDILNTTDDATGPAIQLQSNRATPADSDVAGNIIFEASDSGGTQTDVISIVGYMEETNDTDEAGALKVSVMFDDGTPALDEVFSIFGDNGTPGQGYIKFNEASQDFDFQIETDGTDNYFVIDSGADTTTVQSATSSLPEFSLTNTNTDANSAILSFRKDGNDEADDDVLGLINFYGNDSGDADQVFAYIKVLSEDITNTAEAGGIYFNMELADTDTEYLSMASDAAASTGQINFNSGAADIDFHLDGNDQADLITTNADTDTITFNIGQADSQFIMNQDNVTGTASAALVLIDDERTGANANEKSEASLWIDPEGTYAISIVDGAVYTGGAVYMGDADVDAATFVMQDGAQANDYKITFAMSGDGNGDFSATTDGGSISLIANNTDQDITLTVDDADTDWSVTLDGSEHTVEVGADDVIAGVTLHDAGILKFFDNSDDVSVTMAAATDGSTILNLTGDLAISSDLQVNGGDITSSGSRINITTNSLTKRYAYIPIGYVDATSITIGGIGTQPAAQAGLAAGVAEIFSTEGYTMVDDSADFLRFAITIPSTFVDAGNAGDLVLEFDINEQAGEECNIDVRIFEYGNTTPIITDTLTQANGAGRQWLALDTLSSGIGADADISADDVLYIEVTSNTDNDDFDIYGAGLKYRIGFEATQ